MTARRVFAMPLALGLVSGIGLITALVGDDIWDVLSWAGLGLPIVLLAVLLFRETRRPG